MRQVDACVPAMPASVEGACVTRIVTDGAEGVAAAGVLRGLAKAGLCASSGRAGLPPPFVGAGGSTF